VVVFSAWRAIGSVSVGNSQLSGDDICLSGLTGASALAVLRPNGAVIAARSPLISLEWSDHPTPAAQRGVHE